MITFQVLSASFPINSFTRPVLILSPTATQQPVRSPSCKAPTPSHPALVSPRPPPSTSLYLFSRNIVIKKGDSIGLFLKAVREQLAPEFRELRHVGMDSLMYIKVVGRGQEWCWVFKIDFPIWL